MSVAQGAAVLLGRDIAEQAQLLDYSRENLLILQSDEQTLRAEFPEAYRNLLSCVHQRDGRTPMAYGQDLVASWVVEDWVLDLLRCAGCQVWGAGADRERRVLPNSKVGSASDFRVHLDQSSFPMEFMCDYTGFWRRSHVLHLRDSKFLRLKQEGAVFLGVDALGRRAILLDFRRPVPGAQFLPSHRPYGGKPAWAVPCPEALSFPLTVQEIARRLREM